MCQVPVRATLGFLSRIPKLKGFHNFQYFDFWQVLSSTSSITLNSEEIEIQSAHYKAAGIPLLHVVIVYRDRDRYTVKGTLNDAPWQG